MEKTTNKPLFQLHLIKEFMEVSSSHLINEFHISNISSIYSLLN